MPSPLTGTPIGNILYALGVGADARDARTRRQVNTTLQGNGDPQQNFLNDPTGTIQRVMQIDAPSGMALNDQYTTRQAARGEADRKAATEQTGLISRYLRGIDPTKTDVGAAIDELTPFFTETMKISPQSIANFRQAVVNNPAILAGLDDKAFEAIAKDRFSDTVATPGSYVRRGGETVEKVPYGKRVESTPAGTLSRVFDPNTGRYVTETPGDSAEGGSPFEQAFAPFSQGGAPELTVEALRPHFVAQESSGDYTARNTETGALGAYQVMPETGRALAQRLGLAWRPDYMTRDDDIGRRYQDAIGGAAIQEAIDNSGGDPEALFSYYHGGSDRNKWGPRTQTYASDMLNRVGGGGGGAAAEPVMSATETYNPPKPTAPKKSTERYLTPAEVEARGFRPGTVVRVDSEGNEQVAQQPPANQGGAQLTGRQRENATTKLTLLRNMESQLARVEDAMVDLDKKGWTGYIGGLVPGGLDAESNRFDKAVAGLTALVRNLTRTPGEGAMSDYESRLAAAIPPSRRDTPEGRAESMATLRDLIDNTRAGYEELLQGPQPGQSAAAAPKVGEVRKGYRFKGGDPADPDSWERVNGN
jgi:hypothetical protein